MRTDSSILVRHVIVEIAKVLLLTTAVMVIVVAFGAVIRPLAQNLLGPVGVAKYVALATVPMLQFALPFAGGWTQGRDLPVPEGGTFMARYAQQQRKR